MTERAETTRELIERIWRPHLGALHTMITAADYDGICKLIASLSLDIALEAAITQDERADD